MSIDAPSRRSISTAETRRASAEKRGRDAEPIRLDWGRTVGSCPARLFYDFAAARRDCAVTSSNMARSRFNGPQFRLVKGFNTSLTFCARHEASAASLFPVLLKILASLFNVVREDLAHISIHMWANNNSEEVSDAFVSW